MSAMKLLALAFALLWVPSTCFGERERTRSADVYTRTCDSDLDPTEVLHGYETKNFGCLLVCSILSPSSAKYKDFLEHFALKTHYLSGKECINQTYVCINGTCVINPLKVDPLAISAMRPFPGNEISGDRPQAIPRLPTSGLHGNVSVKFGDAHIRFDDNAFSKADPYVKFYVNSKLIDRTAVRYDTYWPKFNENFFVYSLTRMDILKFEVWNKNSIKDEYMFSITTSCDEILSKRMNQKKKNHYHGLVDRLALTISCGGF